jgi:hypothetical protein
MFAADRSTTELTSAPELVLSLEQAAIVLAMENRVSVRGIATADDLADIRIAVAAKAPLPPPASQEASRQTTTSSKRRTSRPPQKARRRSRRRGGEKTVFIVLGRDTELQDSIFSFVRALKLQPVEFSRAVNRAAPSQLS